MKAVFDLNQIRATLERILADAGHAVGNGDGGEPRATREGSIPDASAGDHNLTKRGGNVVRVICICIGFIFIIVRATR